MGPTTFSLLFPLGTGQTRTVPGTPYSSLETVRRVRYGVPGILEGMVSPESWNDPRLRELYEYMLRMLQNYTKFIRNHDRPGPPAAS